MAKHQRPNGAHQRPDGGAPRPERATLRELALLVGLVLVALVVVGLVGHAVNAPADPSPPTPAELAGTPLGCPENGDPQCVDRELAQRLCDVVLDPALPPTYQAGDPQSIEVTRWDNTRVGLTVNSEYSPGTVSWQCDNRVENLHHILNFDHQQWRDLHTDGGSMPPQLAAILPPK